MKFSLVAALVVVLAVAHGSEAGSLVKRDAEGDQFTKIINDLTAATQDMVEKVKSFEVVSNAQTYFADSKTHIEPLFEKARTEAARLQEQAKPYITNIEEQVKPYITNIGEQIKPLAGDFQAQVKPLTDMMETFFQQVMDQTKALLPPQ